jgi:phosphohistidine phosphatase SixA
MNVYMIRHAQAGDRDDGPRDIYRPLSDKGRRRAGELAEMLSGVGITRILSSPATRCTQTVQPLAEALGLEVEEHAALWEGSDLDEVIAALDVPTDGDLVACSHGDIIPELIERLAAEGATVQGRGCEKGSLWILERDGDTWLSARYLNRSTTALNA